MIIEAHHLSKRFARHAAVLDASLSVPKGAAYALIGANGAGKTTMLRMLANILQPDGGSARILGIDSRRLTHCHFQNIGYVSENQELPERLTVDQYFRYLRRFYPSWDKELESGLRERLRLPADRRLGKLSHGMRMKALLASVLAFRPSLLILDEPLSGLDPLVRDEILDGVLRQADETTILISSHELTEIESFTTHIGFMSEGRVTLEESMDSLAARFREVSVVLPEGAREPADLPARWLTPQTSGRLLRFVETAFAGQEDLVQRLSARFGRIEHCEALPLSLRDLSKALMRASRPEGTV